MPSRHMHPSPLRSRHIVQPFIPSEEIAWCRPGSSDLLMLRMSTCWKLKIDSVTPIIERFNRSRARRIERECILSFDKPVGCESRMLRRWVAFRSSHLDHQGSSPCRVGRVKSRFSQGCHCRTPLLLRIRPVPVGRMQNEVNEMCTVCLSCAGSFVGRDQNFSEGLNSLEVFGRKELRLIAPKIRRDWRGLRAGRVLMLLSSFCPCRKEGHPRRQSSNANCRIEQGTTG